MKKKYSIRYTIEKKQDRYVLYKEIITDTGFNIVAVKSGTYEECKEVLEKVKNEKNKV